MVRLPAADGSNDLTPDLVDDLDGPSNKGSISVPDFVARFFDLMMAGIFALVGLMLIPQA
jgi:hypothetical protein